MVFKIEYLRSNTSSRTEVFYTYLNFDIGG